MITKLNKGKISETETFDDNSNEYKDALAKLQPTPSREENAGATAASTRVQKVQMQHHQIICSERSKNGTAVKIASISLILHFQLQPQRKHYSLFEQANKHIKMLMRNKVPDFAELLVKQSQYLAGIGKIKSSHLA